MDETQSIDVVMEGTKLQPEAYKEDLVKQEDETNGFVDPRVLQTQIHEIEVLEDLSEEKFSESEASSTEATAIPRKTYHLPTGCCYDDRMKLHANADFSMSPHHPEDPRRIESIMKEFRDGGLIYSGPNSELIEILETSPTRWMYRIAAREATMAEILLVHDQEHFNWVEELTKKSSSELREMTSKMDNGRKSLYVGNLTYDAALISAGAAIETCKNVVAGKVKNAFAVIRPPGHHAEHDESMGFCIFNNVPIATRVCQEDFPETCRKVLILDWDVHHGNGIQNMFYDDPNVLYISLHVFKEGLFYPGRPEDDNIADGNIDKCGAGAGIGRNINIGWHDQGMGDGEYMAAFQKIVMPVAREFDPDLVIISAGFDAAAGDELGGCFVSPTCYAHMTHMLMSLAGGKIAVCLEGGYNLKAISRSALAVAKTLMGEPPERMEIPAINAQAAKVISKVKEHQAPYWACLREGIVDVKGVKALGGVRLSEAIRLYQRKFLSDNYKMIPLNVQREKLSKPFENQVLATRSLYMARKLLLIIHDPPEVLAQADPLTNNVESQNAWVTDCVAPYIEWAVTNQYGVMDVNMPVFIPGNGEDNSSFHERPSEMELQNQLKELVCYLWDNYLETYNATDIILMGVGDSYLGVKMLLTSRNCKSKIRGIVNFVSGNLRPIKSETDPFLSAWYKEHSRVYVAANHACWDDEEYARKVRKNRFGMVVRSEEISLSRMMDTHREAACEWLTDMVGDDDETEEDEAMNEAS